MKRKLLLAAVLVAGALGFNANAQQTPVSGTSYYLYNTETGKFLSRGNSWGTKAVTNDFGLPWQVTVTDGKFTLRMYDIVTSGSTKGLGSDGFSDNDSPIAFTPSGDANGYKLQNGSNYLTSPATYGDNVLVSDVNGNTTWQFLNVAEYNARLAAKTASQESAIATTAGVTLGGSSLGAIVGDEDNWRHPDVSSKVPFPSNSSWTQVGVGSRGGYANQGTYGVERYVGGGTYSYTATGLSKGIYKVGIKAMFRSGANNVCSTVGDAGFVNSSAYLSANGNVVQVKDWYSSRASATNPNSTDDFVTIANNGGYLSEVYTYVGDDGNLELKAVSESYWDKSWFLFNGIVLTYYDNSISDADATAILADATECAGKPMLTTTKDALNSAKSTFEGAKTIANYNALSSAISAANTSIAAYANAKGVLDKMTEELANTNVYTASAYATNYADILAAYDARTLENSEATVMSVGSGWHSANSYDDVLLSAWTIGGEACSEYTKALYINTWSTEGNEDGSNFKTPFFEYWTANNASVAATSLVATVSDLTPNGKYSVSILARVRQTDSQTKIANGVTMQVGSGTAVDISDGTSVGSQFYVNNFSASGNADADGKLTITLTVAASSNISWLSFKDVKYGAYASEAEISALNSAIAAAEAHTLGFESGEYAPYTNTDAFEALAAAKAIDTDNAIGTEVVAATTALESATWVANTEELNAVYNGNFALSTANTTSGADLDVPGWTITTSVRQVIEDGVNGTFPALAETTGGKALFTWGATIKYGETAGYTIPLKGHTIYELTFKHAGWAGANNGFSVNVLNTAGKGMPTQSCGKSSAGPQTAGCWDTYRVVFVTDEAGDYVLSMIPSGNSSFTDITLTKAASQILTFAEGSVPTYAPGVYPNVKIDRELTATRWATAVYPFAVSGVDDIYVLNNYAEATGAINLTAATASVANQPFLMRSTAGQTEINLTDVDVKAAAAEDVTNGDLSFKGTYASTEVTDAEKNYVVSNNTIYAVGTASATVGAYRAYFQLSESSPAKTLRFVFDGDDTATGIDGVSGDNGVSGEAIYNAAGQQVDKDYKGIVIKGGKKYLQK